MKKMFSSLFYFLLVVLGMILIAVFVFNAYYRTVNNRAQKRLREIALLTDEGFEYRDLNKNGKLDLYEDSRQPVDVRVEDLLSQMTLEEKVGLMWHPPIGIGEGGNLQEKPKMMSPSSTYALVINKRINHFNLFAIPGPHDLATWANRLQKLAEQTRLGIPVTISTDFRHGLANLLDSILVGGVWSRWPEPIGFAAAGDSSLVVEFGSIARQEYRAVGIHVALHPMADVATEPRWAHIRGTFGEDAGLAARMVAAYIYGFQGDELNVQSVACMTKHWPGGGPQENGEDALFNDGQKLVYPGRNFDYHLIPFETAIRANTAMIMPSYAISLDQTSENVGMGFNKEMITGLLREKYGYDGVICSDWGIIEGFSFLGYEIMGAKSWGVDKLSVEERIEKAIDAGIDQFGGNANTVQLMRLVRKGIIPESRIDESARRLLRVKFSLGLFDQPYVDPEEAVKLVKNNAFKEKGKLAQRKSIVLLKNRKEPNCQPFLPLTKGIRVYAENVDREVLGRYASVVNDPEQADVVLLRLQTPYESRVGDLVESMLHQGRLDFQEPELGRLLTIMAQKPTVVCMYMDRPAVIPEIASFCKGLLVDFGAQDDAVLDVVFGDFNPGARMPFELPSSMEAVMSQKEDVPFDSGKPLFPFGAGLGYD